jgi:enoyl-CoA hydratase/carnithine racemase
MSEVLDVGRCAARAHASMPACVMQGAEVEFQLINRVAVITFNRPRVLNALSHAMVGVLTELFERCRTDPAIVAVVLKGAGEKAFCAGSDIRALYQAAVAGSGGWREFLADECRLYFALRELRKPLVALMDGVTVGGGMGLAQTASLRVVTDRTCISMPETRIGLASGVGALGFLARLPVELGLYFGLTGKSLDGADAVTFGLADVQVPASSLSRFAQRLELLDFSDVRQSIRDVFAMPAARVMPSGMAHYLPLIREHFAARLSIEEIVDSIEAALQRSQPECARQWLQETHDALVANSPLMLNVTREALFRGRQMTQADSLRMEFDLTVRAIEVGDFCEGARAKLVDRDNAPRWICRSVRDVNPAIVRKFFSVSRCPGVHPLAWLGA